MKKIYLTISAIALTTCAMFAQNNRVATQATHHLKSVNTTTNNKVIQNMSPQAAGDTVWVFDGLYSYDWNSTLPVTYSVALEDVDGLTITPTYTAYFGVTGSYKIFYEIDASATNLHYAHADTVFFVGGTSWFASPGQADNWIEFGPIHVPAGGGTLKWLHNYPDYAYRDAYSVLVNTTGLSHTNFTNTPIFSVIDNDPTTIGDTVTTPHYGWYPRSSSVNAYAGQDIYVAFRQTGNDQDILQFTNVMLIDNGVTTNIKNNTVNGFFIGNNIPNPANGSTTINYTLEKNSTVAFSVTDLTGKVMYSENLNMMDAGAHNLNVNTAAFSSGMYFYNFVINGNKVTRKFVVAN